MQPTTTNNKEVSIEYLSKGLTALANAAKKDWFPGHFGAAIIAGEFLISECGLDDVASLVRKSMDNFINTQPSLFKEINNKESDNNWKEKILHSIRLNLDKLRTSGHGVIFGTLALKAFTLREELRTKGIVDGIVKLLELTAKDGLDRYYDIPNYDEVKVEPSDNIPEYKDELDLINACFSELDVVYEDEFINNKSYFFTGCKIHGITHAHALCMLDELGYKDLSKKGYENHRLQMKLNRHKPSSPKLFKTEKIYYPFDKAYWERDLDDTHYIKFPYSAISLLKKLPWDKAEKYKKMVAPLWSY